MAKRSLPLADYHFRPALPQDRAQIRLLLHDPYQEQHVLRQLWQGFGLGIFLALGLHWLLAVGGLHFLVYGLIGMGAIVVSTWLNRRLFGDWQNYWVVEQSNTLIACGKLTCYRTYSVLSDVVVIPERRQQGIGSFLVESFVQQAVKPLYLACFPNRVRFYQRLQFSPVDSRLLAAYLKRDLELDLEPNLVVLVYSGWEDT